MYCLAGLVAPQVEACGVDDRQWLPGRYTFDGNRSPPESYCAAAQDDIITSVPGNGALSSLPQTVVQSSCQKICSSTLTNCATVYISLMSGLPDSNNNYWQCNFYNPGVAPTTNRASGDPDCPAYPPTSVFVRFRETVNSCFAESSSAASAYCVTAKGFQGLPATVYATTTSAAASTATSTVASTVTVTQNAVVTSTTFGVYAYVTSSSILTTAVTATSISTVTITQRSSGSSIPASSVVTVTTTLTTSVCQAVATRLFVQDESVTNAGVAGRSPASSRADGNSLGDRQTDNSLLLPRLIPEPACLSRDNENIPSAVISSACSCLLPATVTQSASTLPAGTVTTVLVSFQTSTVLSTSISFTGTFSTVTSYRFTTLTIPTTIIQPTTTITTVITTTAIASQPSSAQSATTVTVTSTVKKTAVPTFALFARQASGPRDEKFRLRSRMAPDLPYAPENRILQYRRTSGSGADGPDEIGVNATIIEGKLYIFSQLGNPKPHGFSLQLEDRAVFGQQTDTEAGLRGCVINDETRKVTCELPNGRKVKMQELVWPAGGPDGGGRFMLARVPKGNSGKKFQPVMQFVAGSEGTADVDCT